MRSSRLLLALALTVSLAGGAAAQETKAPEPVLDHLPAGALGFVVVHDVEGMMGKVDKLIDELGFGQMLSQPDPQNPNQMKRIALLEMLKMMAQLGPGFDARGGFAAVMLDPQAFDVDLMKLLPMGGGMGAAPGAAGEEAEEPKLPFVLLVPGRSVEDVFGAYPMEAAGKFTKVNLRMGPMLAGKVGGYVGLSPNDKALEALAGAKKKAVAELPDEHVVMLAKSDLGYYINMKVAQPMVLQFMDIAEGQMQAPGPMAPLMSTYFGIYREAIKELADVSVGLRLAPTGIVLDEMVSFKAGGTYDRAMALAKYAGRPPLAGLPDLPYILALAAQGQTDPQSLKITMDVIDELLAGEAFKELPPAEKARFRKVVMDMNEQVTGMQLVIGGAPEGSGLFGLSAVVDCKSSAKVKELIGEKCKLGEALVRHFTEEGDDARLLKIRYLKGVETVGGQSVDAVTLEHPEMADMSDRERQEMTKVLGENKVRFYVAAPAEKRVVVTFGGSRAFLAEALKVASSKSGKIGQGPAVAEAMKYMPADSGFLALLSGSGMYDVIVNGMKVMEPESELPPFKITSKVPIAFGGGKKGRSAHLVAYVPTDLIKEVSNIFMMMGMGGGAAPPPRGAEDF